MKPDFAIVPLDGGDPARQAASAALLENAFGDPERYRHERIVRELVPDDSLLYRRFFVALRDGQVLAVGGVKAADWATKTHLLYLSAVAPEQRGQGIGRALLEARLTWIIGHFGSGRILVSTAKAKRFRELGFKEIRGSEVAGRHLMLYRF